MALRRGRRSSGRLWPSPSIYSAAPCFHGLCFASSCCQQCCSTLSTEPVFLHVRTAVLLLLGARHADHTALHLGEPAPLQTWLALIGRGGRTEVQMLSKSVKFSGKCGLKIKYNSLAPGWSASRSPRPLPARAHSRAACWSPKPGLCQPPLETKP